MADKKPATTTAPAPDPKAKGKKKDEPRDSAREIAETVVFVVVLVLMLKTFVAEAFVIPTGSMAETLYGYQRLVTCDQCGHEFPVNCSSEVDPQRGQAASPIRGCFCPNCENPIRWNLADAPSWSSGDRVLVAKFLYDRDTLWKPKRHQVIVFKYPAGPQQGTTAMNYIKRCEGEPDETLAIFDGDLYVTKFLKYPDTKPSESPLERWRFENTFANNDEAVKFFTDSMKRRVDGNGTDNDFRLIRKPPDVMLAMRRIVFNNDRQPKDLTTAGVRRWQLGTGWGGDDKTAPKVFTHTSQAGETAWMTYGHVVGEEQQKARLEKLIDLEEQEKRKTPKGTPEYEQLDIRIQTGRAMVSKIAHGTALNAPEFPIQGDRRLITNIMGYNTGEGDGNQDPTGRYWVSDLMLDLEVKVESEQGSFVLELSKGHDRFRAVFELASGDCVLQRLTGSSDEERAKNTTELGRAQTAVKKKGTYHVRFANFDERLTVWVDKKLPFGDGIEYSPAKKRGPVTENDIDAPARVGATGANVSVSKLQLWRDTFYTHMEQRGAVPRVGVLGQFHQVETMYVQPGHYLCLGDNSGSSADSRDWGLVPDRLLLGRALWIYFPFWPWTQRFGPIR